MKNVNLKLGTGDVGGGSHESPDVRRLVKAAATFRAGGLYVKNKFYRGSLKFDFCFLLPINFTLEVKQ